MSAAIFSDTLSFFGSCHSLFRCPETGHQEYGLCERCENQTHYEDLNENVICTRCVEKQNG